MLPGAYVPWQRSRLSALVILVALALFLFVKLEFRLPHSNIALYAYGVTVTSMVLMQMFFAMTRYKDLSMEAASLDSGRPPVSCIVAVHNEELLMEQCVNSMLSQTYEPKEIIVVDDASTDRTPHILDALSYRYPILVIRLDENVGKKRALAAGIATKISCHSFRSTGITTYLPTAQP